MNGKLPFDVPSAVSSSNEKEKGVPFKIFMFFIKFRSQRREYHKLKFI